MKGLTPASLDVLDHVKINIELQNPVSTLKGVLMNSKANMSFSKSELTKAEALMTQAFAEFYQKLRLLKSYCFLNQLAFSKIMKKYDKITSWNASKAYLEMVDNSYLSSSDEVTKLIERVEATFVKHFTNGNHKKGMDTLRPKAKRERHAITFFLRSGLDKKSKNQTMKIAMEEKENVSSEVVLIATRIWLTLLRKIFFFMGNKHENIFVLGSNFYQ